MHLASHARKKRLTETERPTLLDTLDRSATIRDLA
jgi:hypothetical protein